jgi:hypothetical protein
MRQEVLGSRNISLTGIVRNCNNCMNAVGIVQHPLLQGRDGIAVELAHARDDPALDRRTGVITKVITVFEIDRFNQQP